MNPATLQAFRECRQDPATDEARLAALVATLLDPELDPATVQADLDELAGGVARSTPWHYLAELGFTGNSEDYEALDNSNLARVLATRRGIPITLGVVLIRVARRGGYGAAGVNFPGHFLVQVDGTLVDPFVMQAVEPQQVIERLPAASRSLPEEALFVAASPVTVGLRMLNNIKLAFTRQTAWHLALDVVDAQLELVPEHPALHLERGDVWRHLGAVTPARQAWERAWELASGTDEAEQVREAVQARLDGMLGEDDDIVH